VDVGASPSSARAGSWKVPSTQTRSRRAGSSGRCPTSPIGGGSTAVIFDELVCGRVLDESRAHLAAVIDGLRRRGCDAVVLGCTELPLILDDRSSPLPTLDSTRILARAALRAAVA